MQQTEAALAEAQDALRRSKLRTTAILSVTNGSAGQHRARGLAAKPENENMTAVGLLQDQVLQLQKSLHEVAAQHNNDLRLAVVEMARSEASITDADGLSDAVKAQLAMLHETVRTTKAELASEQAKAQFQIAEHLRPHQEVNMIRGCNGAPRFIVY